MKGRFILNDIQAKFPNTPRRSLEKIFKEMRVSNSIDATKCICGCSWVYSNPSS